MLTNIELIVIILMIEKFSKDKYLWESDKMYKFFFHLSICFLIILLSVSCGDDRDDIKLQSKNAMMELHSLEKKYNAIKDWEQFFSGKDTITFVTPYSFQIDDVLNEIKDTSIIFLGFLNDIKRNDSGYTVFLTGYEYYLDAYYVVVELFCDEIIKNYLVSNKCNNYYQGFGLVININSYKRPQYDISIIYDEEYVYESEITLSAVDFFILKGKILDAVFICDLYAIEWDENE